MKESTLTPVLQCKVMKNHFQPSKFHDHRIVTSSGTVVGHIRVKPSGLLWAPKGAKTWYGLSIKKFGELFETQGTKQKK